MSTVQTAQGSASTSTHHDGLCRRQRIVAWVLQILAAVIFLQTLFFKFTGAAESVYIFTKLGAEPLGRYASGMMELIAAGLLLVPRTAAIGAVVSLGVISGAIGAHLTKLGITIPNQDGSPGNDGGLLFGLACVVFLAAAGVAWLRRGQLPIVGPRLAPRSCSAA